MPAWQLWTVGGGVGGGHSGPAGGNVRISCRERGYEYK